MKWGKWATIITGVIAAGMAWSAGQETGRGIFMLLGAVCVIAVILLASWDESEEE